MTDTNVVFKNIILIQHGKITRVQDIRLAA